MANIDLDVVEAKVQTAVREAVAAALATFRDPPPPEPEARRRQTRREEVLDWIRNHRGRRAIEIARGVFGPTAIQPDVYGYLLQLEANGQVVRDGRPFRWWPAEVIDGVKPEGLLGH